MYCARFIWEPGEYDAEFHRLDAEIDSVAKELPGFITSESWQNGQGTLRCADYYWTDLETLHAFAKAPAHLQAKAKYAQWYRGYHVVVMQVIRSYGDEALAHITQAAARRI